MYKHNRFNMKRSKNRNINQEKLRNAYQTMLGTFSLIIGQTVKPNTQKNSYEMFQVNEEGI